MREVVCTGFGPLQDLRVVERASAPCGAQQVRVQVRAAGVNFVDALFVQGLYQIKPPLPFVPGNEIAGEVVEAGGEVSGVALGDRVFANVGLGGFASEVVVDAQRVMPTPAALTDGQAATFTQSYLTAMFALRERAAATAGQWLLVLGAGGGVGLAAVDVGRAIGLRVIAAASTEAKRVEAMARGAEAVIDSSSDGVKERAKQLSGGGVDLVYDPVGGAAGETALRALADDGQFLVIGFASGSIPQLPANQVLLRNRRVTGVDWGGWVARGNVAANQAMLADVLALIERGQLHPVEPAVYALDDAARALDDQQHRRVTGKACLVP
jgi:NADPH2:quinone reductase